MTALVGGEAQGTFSRSPGFGLALARTETKQAGGEDLANLGDALGGLIRFGSRALSNGAISADAMTPRISLQEEKVQLPQIVSANARIGA